MADAAFMHQLIEGFGDQLRQALDIADQASWPAADRPLHHVLVAGMGGSGIGASLVSAFTYDDLRVPLNVTRTYTVPAATGPNTLFVASSFSGNTEETLAATEAALDRGAYVVAVTSGGKMQQLADKHGFAFVNIPGDSGSPRAGIGYSFVQLLGILHAYELTGSNYATELRAAADQIDADRAAIQERAKALAKAFSGRVPFFYADERLAPVLLRGQQQINENSKQFAHLNAFPEMNHNELVGWRYPRGFWRQATAVLCRSDYDHPRASKRMDICQPMFAEQGAHTHEVTAQGSSFVEQAIYLIHLFDWTSFYLAELNDVNPFPVDSIDYLKGELAKQ